MSNLLTSLGVTLATSVYSPPLGQRWFNLTIPDEILRKMNREQYYQTKRWLRCCARAVAEEIENNQEND